MTTGQQSQQEKLNSDPAGTCYSAAYKSQTGDQDLV